MIQLWVGKASEAEEAGEDQSSFSEILGHHGHGWALRKKDRRGWRGAGALCKTGICDAPVPGEL